ncbi:MAG: radical SAM protein, partial [Candidatus Altiarchaeota archaeon]|nr:radical SAM protein [Candidatus Altiarchaeota archaeon]
MDQLISTKTKSLCPKCLKVIDAEIKLEDGRVIIIKECKEHGRFNANHFWETADLYNFMYTLVEGEMSRDPDGLVLDVTYDCNMKCPFCYAKKSMEKEYKPSLVDIRAKIKGFTGSTVYLCGGEPTTREDLPHIISLIQKLKKKSALFTNGLKLSDRNYINNLKNAGLDLIVLSLSSLDDKQLDRIYGKEVSKWKKTALNNIMVSG